MFARHWSERKKTERAASVGDYGEVVLNERLRSALARMTEAVHSSDRWPRPHAPAVFLRRIGECLKYMLALRGVMAFTSSGWQFHKKAA